jgi:hypothetical protein
MEGVGVKATTANQTQHEEIEFDQGKLEPQSIKRQNEIISVKLKNYILPESSRDHLQNEPDVPHEEKGGKENDQVYWKNLYLKEKKVNKELGKRLRVRIN